MARKKSTTTSTSVSKKRNIRLAKIIEQNVTPEDVLEEIDRIQRKVSRLVK